MSGQPARRRRPANSRQQRPGIDPARRAAYDALRQVTGSDAYANLVGPTLLAERRITGRDAAFATELLNGTCRLMGSYDLILASASGRNLNTLQPAVVDVLRLGAHQLLSMRVPTHAAVTASVELARATVGERVTGLVNAISRRIADRDLDAWISLLSEDSDELGALALRTHHPRWIVEAYAAVLPASELEPALQANNEAPTTCLAIRPGLATVTELVEAGAEPHPDLPTAAYWKGNPGDLAAVRDGRAGVQDPGSQRVALRLAETDAPDGPWLDCCAGPGGKAALLAGLAIQDQHRLLAGEVQPHRARLVAQALRGFSGPHAPFTVCADATRPAWPESGFAKVMADVPCTGLGALRRRPEARWRRRPEDLAGLTELQASLLHKAIDSAMPGGVVAYVTCSPHQAETTRIVDTVLAARDDAVRVTDDVQLWPHRDGTDAMFCALLRRSA